MRYISTMALFGVIALGVTVQADAFQKERLIGSTGTSTVPAPSSDEAAALGISPGQVDTSQKSGTAITIPGWGAVGVIPKLDFGMELLYGTDNKPAPEVLPEDPKDGLQIRGTLKHRF